MQDNVNPAGSGAADEVLPSEQNEPGAAGEVVKRTRFGIGARATILMGLTMGAVAAAAPLSPVFSHTVSIT
ncbi:MAG TPA: hypothetical protein VGL06_24750 [Pseudonocardiaceae bacterium]|jgi:hypothetical protein